MFISRCVWIVLGVAAGSLWAQQADLAIVNARIYTANPRQPRASAMAVRAGKIVAVGDDVSRMTGPATKSIDAHGMAVLPGLIDSHGHVRGLGTALETLDLRGVKSEKEIADMVRESAKQAKPGDWILGRAWDQNLWAVKEFPTAQSITEAAPDNPVALTRVDGHAIWANRKALEAADVNAATKDPQGGRVMRDPSGAPAGVLLDNAQALVSHKIPEPSQDQIERRILRALTECARLGMTTVHDAGVAQPDIDAYRSLLAKGQLPMRVYVMVAGKSPALEPWLAR